MRNRCVLGRYLLVIATGMMHLNACSADAGSSGAPEANNSGAPWSAPFGASRACYVNATVCSQNYESCFSGCYSSAIYNPGYNCAGVCRDTWPCLGHPQGDTCAVHTYAFSGGEPLADLEGACESAFARDKACGTQSVSGNCKGNAKVESPEMIANYICVAEIPCNGSLTSCTPPASQALESEICNYVEKYCQVKACTAIGRTMLSHSTPWFRADTTAGAKACLQQESCRDITSCLEAWRSTAFPGVKYFSLVE